MVEEALEVDGVRARVSGETHLDLTRALDECPILRRVDEPLERRDYQEQVSAAESALSEIISEYGGSVFTTEGRMISPDGLPEGKSTLRVPFRSVDGYGPEFHFYMQFGSEADRNAAQNSIDTEWKAQGPLFHAFNEGTGIVYPQSRFET